MRPRQPLSKAITVEEEGLDDSNTSFYMERRAAVRGYDGVMAVLSDSRDVNETPELMDDFNTGCLVKRIRTMRSGTSARRMGRMVSTFPSYGVLSRTSLGFLLAAPRLLVRSRRRG